jgi:hypothetical protein
VFLTVPVYGFSHGFGSQVFNMILRHNINDTKFNATLSDGDIWYYEDSKWIFVNNCILYDMDHKTKHFKILGQIIGSPVCYFGIQDNKLVFKGSKEERILAESPNKIKYIEYDNGFKLFN